MFLAPAFIAAAPVTITFDSSLLNGSAGQTLTFSGTVVNTAASPVFLNGNSVNVTAPLTANDTNFFANFPLLLGGAQSLSAAILDIVIPNGTSFGVYTGHFDILGGSTGAALDLIGSANFAVNVAPEPGAGSYLAAGLLVLLLLGRGRVPVNFTCLGRTNH